MMMSGESTMAESPVPLALSKLQPRAPPRMPKGLRLNHRPSLPLASLQESIDEFPRRRSDEPLTPYSDEEETCSDFEVIEESPVSSNGGNGEHRRASAAMFSERYTQLMDFDSTSPHPGVGSRPGPRPGPRRASLAVTPTIDDKGRRRSWAARLQLERKKRRKSGSADEDEDAPPVSYVRQKRPSWWNVFVPDNVLKNRSRRASQQLSRSAESIDQPVRRSKSRSVDHGFAAPFDLDALRSKVEGRFDAVHRDEDEPKRLPPAPPVKTIPYTVKDRDTLTSLAARFDTTPSELTKLNRLGTPFIFPGQTLQVPDKRRDGDKESDGPSESGDTTSESNQSGQASEPCQEKELLDTLRPVSPDAPASTSASPQRFLKINVRHITDGQGVVSGVLLVTPNAVMFDPNVSDTLVLEHGPESYGVIAPMEFVVNAAIFYDIAHMRTHDPDHNAHKAEKAEIYYMNKQTHSPGKDSLLVKDETFPELQAATGDSGSTEGGEGMDGDTSEKTEEREERAEGWNEPPERGGAAFPKAFDRELVTPTQLQQQTVEERRRSLLDHHWAIPSKERMSIDNASEGSFSGDNKEDNTLDDAPAGARAERQPGAPGDAPERADDAGPPALHLVKMSYHDSGIDIREPMLNATPTNTKKVYSDADIVLSAEWVPPVCIAPVEPPLSAPPLGATEERPATTRKPASVSFSLDGNAQKEEVKGDKKNKMLKRLSYPLSWMEGLTGDGTATGSQGSGSQGSQADSLPTSADSHNSGSVFSKVFNSSPMNLVEFGTGLFLSKTPSEEAPQDNVFAPAPGRSSLGGFGRPQKNSIGSAPPRLDYRSMVSMEDKPELFVSVDKLIVRQARPSDDPPLYLRLRMGKPVGRALPRTTPLMSYGRKRMKPEYWFGVPRNRVDDLYKFLNHWVPELYGPLGDVSSRGYQLIDSDTEWDDDDDPKRGEKGERSGSQGDVADLTRESWELLKAPYMKIYSVLKTQAMTGDSEEQLREEVLSMSDELRRALYSSGASVDMEFSPPDLIGQTEILTMEHREKICGVLPARAQGYMWSLVFSTSQNGFSLASMYRKMQRVDSPVLLVVQDTDNNVFGALTSSALHPSEHFYGTGESLLFSFQREEAEETPATPATPAVKIAVEEGGAGERRSRTNSEATEEKKQDDNNDVTLTESPPSPPPSPPAVKTKFRVWQWTGDNMYFIRGSSDNISIGAGDGKFGLWLDGDLNLGRTQQCTTYGNEPLTTKEDFIVKILECWAFI